ncbi:UDP-N-acetylmuramoyl-tripeptide--D-alanyl-D-alanine ligase [Sinobacterium norvegicum]|uniref:UDP-N-acetylmuramoyl-tripeptide--D-alanyl-D-alanine ligase n=1 Tax=Sinobacterium norvegicum TaxID=1641715 RepID=A0ABN8ES80_9GAMM|nr:UDP-N-acetylmuramoyl-tripeptide--D-alanyl-D-alanine ligase [Sinobacterium norvegicum]CAH0993161.1 UDP-N-acetylmuramoyl-tripeptide--D-alanyl-D-alanine ligase [Sinobacterium norvegicum]
MISATTLSQLAADNHWQLIGHDVAFEKVILDSRSDSTDGIFVALVGEHFDSHQFIAQAIENGAVAVVVNRAVAFNIPQLIVDDTRYALGVIARENRRKSTATVIAITGSAGKTTTKEMLSSILKQAYLPSQILATKGNFNNEIGLPLTLLDIESEHQVVVVEMGAAKPGDIAYLMQFAEPDFSILLNAKAVHLEGFGDCDHVAKTKFEIVSALTENKTSAINIDTPYSSQWLAEAKHLGVNVVGYSADNKNADVFADDIIASINSCHFKLHIAANHYAVSLKVAGVHNVSNALAAAAIANAADISAESIVLGLNSFNAVAGRMQAVTGMKQSSIIDDSYNANPDAMRAAIDVLCSAEDRKIFVMGQMGELGKDELAYHRQIGQYAKEQGVDLFYACGELCRTAVEAFGQRGLFFEEQSALINSLSEEIQYGDTVLVKGSRSAKMDVVVAAIVKNNNILGDA